ncbi:MAG TPA: photosynthetic reaction center cytochrome c subunit family protein [Kofleriaceae bacterium]|nr:photosynthetic reaction center cytochrome c subunit family protein [Kofleriaceae bacterium]
MRSILLALSLTGALGLALALTLTGQPAPAHAAPGKNLKVYPKDTDVAQLKKDMKLLAKATGHQCDSCHDLEAMDKDTPLKEKARQMMRMVATINGQLKKDGFKDQVTCNTCHAGQNKPKK